MAYGIQNEAAAPNMEAYRRVLSNGRATAHELMAIGINRIFTSPALAIVLSPIKGGYVGENALYPVDKAFVVLSKWANEQNCRKEIVPRREWLKHFLEVLEKNGFGEQGPTGSYSLERIARSQYGFLNINQLSSLIRKNKVRSAGKVGEISYFRLEDIVGSADNEDVYLRSALYITAYCLSGGKIKYKKIPATKKLNPDILHDFGKAMLGNKAIGDYKAMEYMLQGFNYNDAEKKAVFSVLGSIDLLKSARREGGYDPLEIIGITLLDCFKSTVERYHQRLFPSTEHSNELHQHKKERNTRRSLIRGW